MNSIRRSALFAFVLVGLVGGALAACGGGDEHAGHDHKPGEKHEEHK